MLDDSSSVDFVDTGFVGTSLFHSEKSKYPALFLKSITQIFISQLIGTDSNFQLIQFFFFLQQQFLPAKYDYKRPVTISIEESLECVICMSSVDVRQRDYMITPCDHIFHEACLKEWLEQKMECPVCRGQLPNV